MITSFRIASPSSSRARVTGIGPSPRISHVSSPSTQPAQQCFEIEAQDPDVLRGRPLLLLAGLGRVVGLTHRAAGHLDQRVERVRLARFVLAVRAGLLEQFVEDRFVRGLELGLRLDRPAEERLPRALARPCVASGAVPRGSACADHRACSSPSCAGTPPAHPTATSRRAVQQPCFLLGHHARRVRDRVRLPRRQLAARIAAAVSASFCTRLEVWSSLLCLGHRPAGRASRGARRRSRHRRASTHRSPRPAAPATSSRPQPNRVIPENSSHIRVASHAGTASASSRRSNTSRCAWTSRTSSTSTFAQCGLHTSNIQRG